MFRNCPVGIKGVGVSRRRYLRVLFVCLVFSVSFFPIIAYAEFTHRWIFVQNSFDEDTDVLRTEKIIKDGRSAGFNGIVLASKFDSLDLQPAQYAIRIKRALSIAQRYGLDIIPCAFSLGYAASILSHNENLAACYPVKDLAFRIDGSKSFPLLIHQNEDREWEFEESDESLSIEKPGKISFLDKKIFHSGHTSLRMENFCFHPSGNARLSFLLKVTPYTAYTIECCVRGNRLPKNPPLQVKVFSGDGKCVMWREVGELDNNWQHVSVDFYALHYNKLRAYVGIWGGTSGQIWIDDLKFFRQRELKDVVRREGAPLLVVNAKSGEPYQEGRDFTIFPQKKGKGRYHITTRPEGLINDGAVLRVSYYKKYKLGRGQISACMAVPEVYEIWKKQIGPIENLLHPKAYFLSLDEIRQGGYCGLCNTLNLSELLGRCVKNLYRMIKHHNPNAQLFLWSDMFDPYMGAVEDYVMTRGGFKDSWHYLPSDVVPVVWNDTHREASCAHFKNNGFRTVVSVCIDGRSRAELRRKREAISRLGGIVGIMYTTWQKDYSNLSEFGELFFE